MHASPIIGALLVLALASAAVAQAPVGPGTQSHLMEGGHAVAVARGERVVLQIAADGALTVASVAAIAPGSVAVVQPTPGAPLPPSLSDAMKNTAAPGTLALTLGDASGPGSNLKIESGLDRHVGYRAGIVSLIQGKLDSKGTSVCSVPPHTVSVENWPQPVIRVVASDFTDRPGSVPTCG